MSLIPKCRFAAALLVLVIAFPGHQSRAADVPAVSAWAAPAGNSGIDAARPLHPVSRQEIFQAIQDDLARRGVAGRAALRPGDLIIQSAVPALKQDAGLRAKSVRYDPIRRETVFELWASQEPQFLPFEVTTRRAPESWGGAALAERQRTDPSAGEPATGATARAAQARPPVLAKPGTTATLVIVGENVRITTTVLPLQPGIKGQRILVRDWASGRVMNADVVGAGLLQASF